MAAYVPLAKSGKTIGDISAHGCNGVERLAEPRPCSAADAPKKARKGG